jgi:hypothetical protein
MPILIILLFYINDLVKIKRYYSQTEFVGQQMANMIQNVSKNRGTDQKKITKEDLKNAFCLAWLTVFPNSSSMFYEGNSALGFGYLPHSFVYYVRGLNNGQASCFWRAFISPNGSSHKSPLTTFVWIYTTDNKGSPVRMKTSEVNPSEIYPSLKIEPGQEKIIIVSSFYRKSSYLPSNKQSFGFYLLDPKHLNENDNTWYFFHSVVIFTPKPGLFTETAPS